MPGRTKMNELFKGQGCVYVMLYHLGLVRRPAAFSYWAEEQEQQSELKYTILTITNPEKQTNFLGKFRYFGLTSFQEQQHSSYKNDVNTSDIVKEAPSAYHVHSCPSGLVPEERSRLVTAECAGSLQPAHLLHIGLLTWTWLRPKLADTLVQDFAGKSRDTLSFLGKSQCVSGAAKVQPAEATVANTKEEQSKRDATFCAAAPRHHLPIQNQCSVEAVVA